ARLGGMAVSAYRSQTRSVPAYRRPECLLKSRMCERHLSGSVRAWAATFGEHPVYSTCALCHGSLLPRPRNDQSPGVPRATQAETLRSIEDWFSGLQCPSWANMKLLREDGQD